MAWQMSFTCDNGMTAPAAYWIPVQVNLNKVQQTGQITFLGYSSMGARNALMAPIAGKQYTVMSADYAKFFQASDIQPAGVDHLKQAYAYALTQLEGPLPPNGQPDTRTSFFATATEV